jgi:DNA invertase Pin-like site-specific DNA recombinase
MQLLQSWGVSLIAQNGFQFDLTTPHGKLIAQLLASLAEFERDLIRERVKSGISLAKSRGRSIGRRAGQCPQQEKLKSKILSLKREGRSIRAIAKDLNCSPGTVQKVLKAS